LKARFRFDDSLDVVGIHGVGGVVGTLCLGIFASTQVNPGGFDGLLAGNAGQIVKQIIGVAVVGGYTLVVSWVLLKVIEAVMGLSLTEEAEVTGLDSVEHSETAYNQ
jgi:Amt family ammonium transporter